MRTARSTDDLDAARGIANGILFGAVLWAVFFWLLLTSPAQACAGAAAQPAPAPVIQVLVA
jgi:hypothetical protein